MAFDNPPFVMDGTTTDGETIRRALGALLSPAGGIVTPGDLAVAQQATPNMTVQIGAGEIWVPGTSTPSQGPYYSRNGGATTVAIGAANVSLPRIDTVIVQVQDAAYAGALAELAPAVVPGTPSAGASLPNLTGAGLVPASSTVIAYVLVPAGATSILTADILNVPSQASAGLPTLLPTTATATRVGVPGESVLCSPAVEIILLSPATRRLPIQAMAGAGVNAQLNVVSVGSISANIIGKGLPAGGGSFVLLGTPGATVTLLPDGTYWRIVDGQFDSGWFPLPLANGWAALSGAYVPAVRIQGDKVEFRGGLSAASASSTTVATLLAAFRPAHSVGSALGGPATLVQIDASGTVALGAIANVFLDSVSYSLS